MRDTSHIGEITRTQVIAALTVAGKAVLMPMGDFRRYDIGIDDDGRLLRVQCKTGRLVKGSILFHTCSVDSRSTKGRCIRKGYRDQIELFGVYCPRNRKCYLVPVQDAPTGECALRITPPRNNQKKGIRWAEEYEIRG